MGKYLFQNKEDIDRSNNYNKKAFQAHNHFYLFLYWGISHAQGEENSRGLNGPRSSHQHFPLRLLHSWG